MVWNRTLFLVALVASLALSALLSFVGWYAFDMPLFTLFLFLPFLPILFRPAAEARRRACPRCGWATVDPGLSYCPRDGEKLGS